MKKIFTLVAAAVMALAANAKDYKGNISIDLGLGGEPTKSETTISVNESEDGTYEIVLNQFSFMDQLIGNVTMDGIEGTTDETGKTTFKAVTKTASITEGGDIAGILGGKVDVTIADNSTMTNSELNLNITLSVMAFNISAEFNGTYTPLNQDFSDNMIVSLDNGESFLDGQLPATINVQEQEDGKYTFSIKNFAFGTMGIGNITATDIEGVEENGVIKLSAENKNITITDGDTPDMDWTFGKLLTMANPAITLKAEIEGNGLNAKITIPVHIPGTIDMDVVVVFGADYIAAGIDHVTVTPNASGVDEIYDLSGRKLNSLQKGINIVRKADGTTVKVLNK